MQKYIALHNGYLPKFKLNGVETTGLVTKGDIVEYDGIRRGWLKELDAPAAKAVDDTSKPPAAPADTMTFTQLAAALAPAVKGKSK